MKLFKKGGSRKRSFILVFGVVTAFSMSPLMDAVSRAGTDAVANVKALLQTRSPGPRPAGALLQTKAKKLARLRKPAGPRQYAAPKFRAAPAAEVPGVAAAPPLFVPVGAPLPLAEVLPPDVPPIVPPPPLFPPSGSEPPDTPPPPPLITPVPEPAVWIQLIVGFGAIGTLLRLARRARADEPSPIRR